MDQKLRNVFPNKSYNISDIVLFSWCNCNREFLYYPNCREENRGTKQVSQKELLRVYFVLLVLGLEKKLKVKSLPYVTLPWMAKGSWWPGVVREGPVEGWSSEPRLQTQLSPQNFKTSSKDAWAFLHQNTALFCGAQNAALGPAAGRTASC